MTFATRLLTCWGCLSLLLLPRLGLAEPLVLVQNGQAQVVIHAPGENASAGRRLQDRLFKLTGAQVPLETADLPPDAALPVIAVGTLETNLLTAGALASESRIADLGEEGYLLKVSTCHGRRVLLASGKTACGVHHAISELVSWKLRLTSGGAEIDDNLDEHDKPALRYRMIWTWDGHCNWAPTMDESMALYVNENPAIGSTVVPYTADGFRSHFTRCIDYLCDHKLNGLIVWGFLRDDHGGLEMGQEISSYAKQNNVRILPGVCSQGGYGGFIFSTSNRFNLEVWCKQHPELQARKENGDYVPGMINPSLPENQQWLREGSAWLFENLPDIGGINLENGDFMSCHCDLCKAERAKPENDPNCFWDMMASQRPILEVARQMRPDGWMTFATYVGFTEPTARNIGKQAVYPPLFLQQTPDNAICQWTFTATPTPESWPADARPPVANFRDHIGLLHHGSLWGSPMQADRWWAGPGAFADEYSTLLPFICSRVQQTQFSGLVITAQNGDQFPAHELNLVAMEYFSWHPEKTYEQFRQDRLDLCYGGPQRTELFLNLLRSTSKAAPELEAAQAQALHEAAAVDLDARQRARWKNLAGEMARRIKLIRTQEQTNMPEAGQ